MKIDPETYDWNSEEEIYTKSELLFRVKGAVVNAYPSQSKLIYSRKLNINLHKAQWFKTLRGEQIRYYNSTIQFNFNSLTNSFIFEIKPYP